MAKSKRHPSLSSRKRPFVGRTEAYRRFVRHTVQTELLLRASISGLSQQIDSTDTILEKIGDFRAPKGPVPKDYQPSIDVAPAEEGNIKVSLDERSAGWLRRVLKQTRILHSELRFHLYAILAVSIWGGFETYVLMLFEELFARQPAMPKSNEVISCRDAVDHGGGIVPFLIERQLERIGRFTLKELLKYFEDRTNLAVNRKFQNDLETVYFVRNIIAHNSGIVRPGYRHSLPRTLRIDGSELRVTLAFLKRMLSTIERSVQVIERHVIRKFYS